MTDRERFHLIKSIQNAEPENGMLSVSVGVMNEILDLLKEQEPVSVYEAKISKCACGNIVNRYYHPKFCGYCGKKLMWY